MYTQLATYVRQYNPNQAVDQGLEATSDVIDQGIGTSAIISTRNPAFWLVGRLIKETRALLIKLGFIVEMTKTMTIHQLAMRVIQVVDTHQHGKFVQSLFRQHMRDRISVKEFGNWYGNAQHQQDRMLDILWEHHHQTWDSLLNDMDFRLETGLSENIGGMIISQFDAHVLLRSKGRGEVRVDGGTLQAQTDIYADLFWAESITVVDPLKDQFIFGRLIFGRRITGSVYIGDSRGKFLHVVDRHPSLQSLLTKLKGEFDSLKLANTKFHSHMDILFSELDQVYQNAPNHLDIRMLFQAAEVGLDAFLRGWKIIFKGQKKNIDSDTSVIHSLRFMNNDKRDSLDRFCKGLRMILRVCTNYYRTDIIKADANGRFKLLDCYFKNSSILCSHPLIPEMTISFREWLYFEISGQPNWKRLNDLSIDDFDSEISAAFAANLPTKYSGVDWQFAWDSLINDPHNSIDFQKYLSKEIILQAFTGWSNPSTPNIISFTYRACINEKGKMIHNDLGAFIQTLTNYLEYHFNIDPKKIGACYMSSAIPFEYFQAMLITYLWITNVLFSESESEMIDISGMIKKIISLNYQKYFRALHPISIKATHVDFSSITPSDASEYFLNPWSENLQIFLNPKNLRNMITVLRAYNSPATSISSRMNLPSIPLPPAFQLPKISSQELDTCAINPKEKGESLMVNAILAPLSQCVAMHKEIGPPSIQSGGGNSPIAYLNVGINNKHHLGYSDGAIRFDDGSVIRWEWLDYKDGWLAFRSDAWGIAHQVFYDEKKLMQALVDLVNGVEYVFFCDQILRKSWYRLKKSNIDAFNALTPRKQMTLTAYERFPVISNNMIMAYAGLRAYYTYLKTTQDPDNAKPDLKLSEFFQRINDPSRQADRVFQFQTIRNWMKDYYAHLEQAYMDALVQLKATNPDWRDSAQKKAYVEDLEHVIFQLHQAVEKLTLYRVTNGVMDEGSFADSVLLEIKWEFGVKDTNTFRPGWIPHIDDEIRQMQAQSQGYFSGNLATIQKIRNQEVDALVPGFYDFENQAYRVPPKFYYIAFTKICEIIDFDGVNPLPIERLRDYLLRLSQQTSP